MRRFVLLDSDPMQNDLAAQLAARYNREALAYRDLWAPILLMASRRLVSEVAGQPARLILDVGSGVGTLLPEIRAAFPQSLIVAADRSPGMLALAPARFPRVVMDAGRLGVASRSVDLVILAFVLFHLQDPLDGLREARRVLKHGGRVGTLTWGGELMSPAHRIWNESLDAHGADPPDPAAEARHEPVNTPEKMEALFRIAGFTPIHTWAGDLVTAIDLERLLKLKTSMGSQKPRFDSLSDAARAACVAEARRRMETLDPGEFTARGRVVHGLASAS